MKTLVVAAAFAGLLALAGASHAAEISSPGIFGSGQQELAECVVVNGGTTAQKVTVKIFNFYGVMEAQSNCYGSLGPGEFCSLGTPADLGFAPWACVVTAPNVAQVRATMVLHDRVPDGFGSYYYRPIRSAPLR